MLSDLQSLQLHAALSTQFFYTKVFFSQDTGVYGCQISTTPHKTQKIHLVVLGKYFFREISIFRFFDIFCDSNMQESCVTSPLPLLALQNQVGLFPYEQLGGETKEKDKSVEIQQQPAGEEESSSRWF